MDNDKLKLIADGIRMLLEHNNFYDEERKPWINQYDKVFPKEEPFGGPIINEEDNTS